MNSLLNKVSKKLVIFGIFFIVIIFSGWLYSRNLNEEKIVIEKEDGGEKELSGVVDINEVYDGGFGERMFVDLDGDGVDEEIKAFVDLDMGGGMDTYLVVYVGDKKIAEFYPGISIMAPMTNSFKTYSLDSNNSEEFFSFNFSLGTHSSETMFFGLSDDYIYPVCFEEEIAEPEQCLFFSEAMDSLIVSDIDGDGMMEVVETGIERGPFIGELTKEEEAAIDDNFSDLSEEEGEKPKEIAMQGDNRTGRIIATEIYSYDGDIFKKLDEEEYGLMLSKLVEKSNNIVSRDETPLSNLEFIELVRDFWSQRDSEE